MCYYISKSLKQPFDQAVKKVIAALKKEEFGVLTEVDVRDVFKKKLDIDFPKYKILGACNPRFAHKALLQEDKIGTMLPCNVIVREQIDSSVDVAAVNPLASMAAVENGAIEGLAHSVTLKLENVVKSLK